MRNLGYMIMEKWCPPYLRKKRVAVTCCGTLVFLVICYLVLASPSDSVGMNRELGNGDTGECIEHEALGITEDAGGGQAKEEEQEVRTQKQEHEREGDEDTKSESKNREAKQENVTVEIFPKWTTHDPHDKTFTRRLFIYTAVVAIHHVPPTTGTEIHLVTFQEGERVLQLTCCLKASSSSSSFFGSGEVYSGQRAVLHYHHPWHKFTHASSRLVNNTIGMVYRCRFPVHPHGLFYATLTPDRVCPQDREHFVKVDKPVLKPGGLAICAKIVYGLRLNPNKLVEWFEIQRILGVDKILLYDLWTTALVYMVLSYYQETGLLDLHPYKLPGKPYGRSILKWGKDYFRYMDDDELILWDCHLRLAGFSYVEAVDMDEVILPRHYTSLKPFIKDQFSRRPLAASIHFKPQLFISSWAPVDPQAPLYMLRYLRSTVEHNWIYKHIYRPERVHQGGTHFLFPYQGFTTSVNADFEEIGNGFVPNKEAAIFHYRDKCKKTWPFNCTKNTLIDPSMLRFKEKLIPAVTSVRKRLGLPLL